MKERRRTDGIVPSLYVRVYRVLLLVLTVLVGSLTIREGIS